MHENVHRISWPRFVQETRAGDVAQPAGVLFDANTAQTSNMVGTMNTFNAWRDANCDDKHGQRGLPRALWLQDPNLAQIARPSRCRLEHDAQFRDSLKRIPERRADQ